MIWFADNPWPTVLFCVCLGSIFFGMGFQGKLKRNWGVSVLLFCAAGLVIYLESVIITPAEEVEIAVQETVQACIDGDVDRVVDHISANNIILRGVVRAGLSLADIGEDMHVTDMQVSMLADDSRAKSHFRVNGSISINSLQHQGHAATRWNLTWQQEGEKWKIIDVERLNPITGDTMDILRQSES
ncbi:MAG: hypothetical protein JKY95_19375 [Planctomycetaceae bacterium]|nr:hypothetical protein [Planctomycetaceae bacterium]